jgi:hypothetical protein
MTSGFIASHRELVTIWMLRPGKNYSMPTAWYWRLREN